MENIKIGKEINRGDLFYAELNGKIGSEQKGTRPVVILQNDLGNRYSTTVIVAPLTTQVDSKPKLRTHVNVENYGNKLIEDSIILTEQITVIDKCRLISYIGKLDSIKLEELDRALVISLGINLYDLKKEILHKDNMERKIEVLTRRQIASYGIVAREHLKNVGNLEISNEQFGKYILTLIELYSPNIIEEYAKVVKERK